MDLRSDPESINELEKISRTHVTPEEGMSVAQKIGATLYLETSSRRGTGVHEVFEHAARKAFRYQIGKEKTKAVGESVLLYNKLAIGALCPDTLLTHSRIRKSVRTHVVQAEPIYKHVLC